MRKAMIYHSSMLGDLKPLTRGPHPKAKGTKMLMILEALQMQCYDAMRNLRVKIGVLHMLITTTPQISNPCIFQYTWNWKK